MALDDLEMMANPPLTDAPARIDRAPESPAAYVDDAEAADHDAAQAEIGKAAAAETMPAPKEECEACPDTPAERIARRGQDPPDPERI